MRDRVLDIYKLQSRAWIPPKPRPGDVDSSLPIDSNPGLRGQGDDSNYDDEPKKKTSYYASVRKRVKSAYKGTKKGAKMAYKRMAKAIRALGGKVKRLNKKAIAWGKKNGPKAIKKIAKMYEDLDRKMDEMINGKFDEDGNHITKDEEPEQEFKKVEEPKTYRL